MLLIVVGWVKLPLQPVLFIYYMWQLQVSRVQPDYGYFQLCLKASRTSRVRILNFPKTTHFPHSKEVLKLMVNLWRKALGFILSYKKAIDLLFVRIKQKQHTSNSDMTGHYAHHWTLLVNYENCACSQESGCTIQM